METKKNRSGLSDSPEREGRKSSTFLPALAATAEHAAVSAMRRLHLTRHSHSNSQTEAFEFIEQVTHSEVASAVSVVAALIASIAIGLLSVLEQVISTRPPNSPPKTSDDVISSCWLLSSFFALTSGVVGGCVTIHSLPSGTYKNVHFLSRHVAKLTDFSVSTMILSWLALIVGLVAYLWSEYKRRVAITVSITGVVLLILCQAVKGEAKNGGVTKACKQIMGLNKEKDETENVI